MCDCYISRLCLHDVTGAEHGPCDPTTEFALETSTGSAITDVSVLQAALKNGNVVIRIQT